MIIEEITIKNFLSHKKTNIKLGLGITTLVGENGSGKSSVLDAIYYALFNKCNRATMDELITRGEKNLEVNLTFNFNKKRYNISRKRRKGSSTAILKEITSEENPKILASNVKDVTKHIEDIIGLNEDLFRTAIYIQQGEIDDLIAKHTPSERKEIVGRLLGLNKFELAYKEMGNVIKYFDQKFAKTSGEIMRIPKIEEDLKKERIDVNKQKSSIDRLRTEYQDFKKEYEEKGAEFRKLKTKKKAFEKLNSILIRINTNLDSEKKNTKRIKIELEKIRKAEEKLEIILPKLKHITESKKAKELIGDLEKLEIKLKPISDELKQYIQSENTIQDSRKDYDKFISNQSRLKDLEIAIEQLNKSNIEYETKKGIKETLEQEIEKDEEILKTILKNMRKKDYEISTNNNENIEFLKNHIEVLEKEKRKLNRELSELEEKSGIEEGIIIETMNFIKTLDEAKDLCPVCSAPLTAEHKVEVLDIQNMKISKSKNKKEEFNDKKNDLESLKSKIEKEIIFLKDKLNPKDFSKLTNKIGKNMESLKELNDRLSKLDEKVAEFKSLTEERKTLQKKQEELKPIYENCSFAIKTIEGKSKQQIETNKSTIENQTKLFQEELNRILLKTNITEEEINVEIGRLEILDGEKKNLEAIVKRKDQQNEEFEKSNNLLGDLKTNKSIREKEISNLKFDSNVYSKIEEDYEKIREEYYDTKLKLNTQRATHKQKKEYIKKLDDDLKDLKEKSKQQEKLNNYIQFLKKIQKLFHKDGIPEIIRQDSKPKIEYYTQRIFQNFNLSFTGLNLTDDYNIILNDNLNEYKFGLVSGGEKIAAALALRLGIAKALAGKELELVLLDEPTIHLDPQRREDLVGILIQMRSIPQVIVVSHHEELKKAADTILIVEIKNGYSNVRYEIGE